MAKKKVERGELLAATERLLVEKGYDGFNFSLLSERLGVGRSTLYDHFSNKDDLIAAYMTDAMDRIITACERLRAEADALQQIKGMITIFHAHSQIHQIVQLIPALKNAGAASEKVARALLGVQEDHQKLAGLLSEACEKAKQQNAIRQGVPTAMIAALLFQSVLLPNPQGLSTELWSEQVFDLLYHGLHEAK
ncbi:TetR family transcriptional regulator [Tumebacillus sp. BK434]|uniref:TetR/AcrR family transcriptional regulator n=1 Tax=Tumebacillus sp. BK434 TaxID=2512169 RepID=UPI00104BB387|nr:TetR/AcrR family transcriptional regulator [Tumebacillus sp. BK434]TCP59559.1 TetR family transcriptional regulator [Tumebacillus sp. BK434]